MPRQHSAANWLKLTPLSLSLSPPSIVAAAAAAPKRRPILPTQRSWTDEDAYFCHLLGREADHEGEFQLRN